MNSESGVGRRDSREYREFSRIEKVTKGMVDTRLPGFKDSGRGLKRVFEVYIG